MIFASLVSDQERVPTVSSFCIARQPIVDAKLRAFAYELFFRPSGHASANLEPGDADIASSRVLLSSFIDGGPDDIVEGKTAFINVPPGFLSERVVTMLPKDQVVLELDIKEAHSLSSTALTQLREAGYQLALDRFELPGQGSKLLSACDVVKLDLRTHGGDRLERTVARVRSQAEHVRLYGTCIETREEFERCRNLGFEGFQGYFLCRPTIVASREIPGPRLGIVRTLAAVSRADVDFKALETIIRQDVTLTYRLLRIANSSFYSRGASATTIRGALARLGMNGTREWISLLSMSQIDDKPHELIVIAMIRAKFCEELAMALGREDADRYFLTGLLSMVDAIMDQPIERLIELLNIDDPLARALAQRRGPLGRILRCAIAQESGDWAGAQIQQLGREDVQRAYLQAIRWAREMGGLV